MLLRESYSLVSGRRRRAQLGRNPKTGVEISVAETHHPVFRTGVEMKARLAGTPGNALRAAFHKLPD
jgi:nucleoid DNA-binding protein